MKKILGVLICVFIILLGSACNAKETNLSSKGRQIHEPCTRIRYDENGNMIIKEKVNQYGDPEEQWFYVAADLVHHYSSKYEYDSKGRITRCETWIEDEFSHYEVDEYTGNTMIGKVYDVDGNVIQTTKGVLNDNFLTVQKEYYDNQGKFQDKETVEYDDYENIAMMERKANDQKAGGFRERRG